MMGYWATNEPSPSNMEYIEIKIGLNSTKNSEIVLYIFRVFEVKMERKFVW